MPMYRQRTGKADSSAEKRPSPTFHAARGNRSWYRSLLPSRSNLAGLSHLVTP
jgi:hypothetical protein